MSSGRPISEEDLHGYVDEALDPPRRADVEAYLAEHPDIARRVAADARQRAELRAALAPYAGEPVPAELSVARLLEAHPVPRRPRALVLAVAAAVLIGTAGLGGLAGWSLRGASQPPLVGVAALAQEATDSYRVYAPDRVHPVELRPGDAPDLVAWLSSHLARPVSVPDLSRAGYRFMGGRVVATAHGAAGLLMYDDDRGTRMVVLIRPMAVEPDAAMAPHASGSVRGYSWARRGLGYSVVAEAPADSVHSLADEIRRQSDAAG